MTDFVAALASRMTPFDIDALRAVDRIETVYVLIFENEIVYIGRTVNIWQRLDFHRFGTKQDAPKKFDRVLRLDLPPGDAAACEGALIRRFNPRMVEGSPSDEGRDAEVLAWFGLEPDQAARDAFIQRRRELFRNAHRRKRVREFSRRGWNRAALQRVLWKQTLRFLSKRDGAKAS